MRSRLGVPLLTLATLSACGPEEDTPRRHASMLDPMKLEQALSVCPGAHTLPGIDVSHYDGTISWPTVASAGIKWAYAKATESVSNVDPTFSGHWSGMKSAGVARGAYHFFHPDRDGRTQADHFLSVVGTIDATDLPPVLDWETTTATGSTAAGNAQDFIDEVRTQTGRETVIYTSPGLWSQFNISGGFSNNPVWVAHYKNCTPGPSCCPTVPSGWSQWVMWQWDDTTAVSGVGSSEVDVDIFDGTPDDLTSFIASTVLGGTGGGTGAGGGSGETGGGSGAMGGGSGTGGGGIVENTGGGSAGGTAAGGGGMTGGGPAGGGASEPAGGGAQPGEDGGMDSITPVKTGCGCATSDGFAMMALGAFVLRRRRTLEP